MAAVPPLAEETPDCCWRESAARQGSPSVLLAAVLPSGLEPSPAARCCRWILLPAGAGGSGEARCFSQFVFLTQLTVTGTP